MNKFKNLLILAFFLLATSLLVNSVFAVEEASPSSETTANLKERIEKIVNEKKEQIEASVEKIGQEKRGFIAEITRISEGSVTVKSNKGSEVIVITENTDIKKANKEIQIDDLEVGNWLLIMGIVEDENFRAIRILASSKSLRPTPKKVILGSIENIDNKNVNISPRDNSGLLAFNLNKNTEYEDINGDEIGLNDIEAKTQAIIIATDDEDLAVQKIRILTVTENE